MLAQPLPAASSPALHSFPIFEGDSSAETSPAHASPPRSQQAVPPEQVQGTDGEAATAAASFTKPSTSPGAAPAQVVTAVVVDGQRTGVGQGATDGDPAAGKGAHALQEGQAAQAEQQAPPPRSPSKFLAAFSALSVLRGRLRQPAGAAPDLSTAAAHATEEELQAAPAAKPHVAGSSEAAGPCQVSPLPVQPGSAAGDGAVVDSASWGGAAGTQVPDQHVQQEPRLSAGSSMEQPAEHAEAPPQANVASKLSGAANPGLLQFQQGAGFCCDVFGTHASSILCVAQGQPRRRAMVQEGLRAKRHMQQCLHPGDDPDFRRSSSQLLEGSVWGAQLC